MLFVRREPVSETPRDLSASRPFIVLCAILIALGVFLRFYHLERMTLWEDETNAVMRISGYQESDIVAVSGTLRNASDVMHFLRLPSRANDHLGNTVASLQVEDPQHSPIYYVVAHAWARIFGTSATSLRALSAAFGVLALGAVFWLSRLLFGRRDIALASTALVAIAPFFIRYSQEVREYSLWTAVLCANCALFLAALRGRSIARWSWYGVSLAVALYVDPLSGFVALGQGVFLVFFCTPPRIRTFAGFTASAGLAFASYVPWLRYLRGNSSMQRGLSKIMATRVSPLHALSLLTRNTRGALMDLGPFSIGRIHSNIVNALLTALVLLVLAASCVLLVRSEPRQRWAFLGIALAAAMLPLVIHDIVSGGGLVYQTRYFAPLYVAIAIAIAAATTRAFDSKEAALRGYAAAVTVVLVAGALLSDVVTAQARTWSTKDFERDPEVAAIIMATRNPVVVSDFGTSRILSLAYYLPPDTPVRLNLRCDQCSLVQPPDRALLDALPEDATTFLLVPSPELAAEARSRHLDARTIEGNRTFPATSGPLSLFGSGH